MHFKKTPPQHDIFVTTPLTNEMGIFHYMYGVN